MTSRKHQKRLARTRAAKTGESYTTALRHLRSRLAKGGDMPTSDAKSRVPANCSFCDKPSTEVRKLVCGPGVFICDECIDVCNEVVAHDDAAVRRDDLERPAAELLLTRIRVRARTLADMEAELRRWVVQSRQAFGVDWQRIAAELGTTPEAARDRFPVT